MTDELNDPDRDFAVIPPELDEGNETDGYFKVTARAAQQIKAVIAELVARRCESLKFYEELPGARAFHRSDKFMRVLRGGNRSSKTTAAATEVARALTGQDPHNKYRKRNGTVFAFGLDGKHLGLTMFPKLFQPGAFRAIRDGSNWRAFHPWEDSERIAEAIPAPPLIPPRFISEIAWEEKRTKTPKMVRMTTGWTIWFFSSLANAPHGQEIDLGWIDEEVEADDLIAELVMRCLGGGGYTGRLIWSAARQLGSKQMLELQEKWEDGNPEIEIWDMLLKDNPYIDKGAKDIAYGMLSEEERKVRWYGEDAGAAAVVYPEFSEHVHGFNPEKWGFKEPFSVPYDWPVYAAVDPGRQVCAVSFWTVPPPGVGKWKLMFDELYIRECTAHLFGKSFAEKTRDRILEELLIDHHGGRHHDANYGHQIEEMYRLSLLEHKVETRIRGCYFTWGASEAKSGVMAVHEMLRVKPDGEPSFYVYVQRCPNFMKEIRRYRNKKIGRGVGAIITDEPEKRNDHLMDAIRYLAVRNPQYVLPQRTRSQKAGALQAFEAKKKRRKEKNQGEEAGVIRLG